jgi:N-6 DNA Methylase
MKPSTRTKQTGEVFTPRSLIREMLSRLPSECWFDPNKRWLEPAAGDGNFLVEIKARLLQAGHDEQHILDNMLFSIELIDDNHWALQHRLGYLVDGNPNPKFWPNGEHFAINKIHRLTQDLNDKNPYHEKLGLERDEVLHHRNHICWSGLEYDMSFGRETDELTTLALLPVKDLGEWPETDTPDVGERYVVEKMLGEQPQSVHAEAETPSKKIASRQERAPKPAKPVPESSDIGNQLPISQAEVEELFGEVAVKTDASSKKPKKMTNKCATWYQAGDNNIIAFSLGGGAGESIPEDAIYIVKTEKGFFTCTKQEWCDNNGTIRKSGGYKKPGFGAIAEDRFNPRSNSAYKPLGIQ